MSAGQEVLSMLLIDNKSLESKHVMKGAHLEES